MAKLIVKSGTKVIKAILLNKPSFRVGRLNDNDLVLPDNMASRYHCKITLHNNKYILTDLQSANGTMVNRKKVITHPLEDNDEIQIDAYTIVFQEGSTFMPSGAPARFESTPAP
ncbi:MAG: FHA domain-containing protein, partial [Kiritimatiellota bacterium]|nr:FHA domain-containing protein [Kiritimatiellota bacterium]